MIHTLGNCSLWLSTAIYILWFVPQLRLTWKRQSTDGISFGMHLILYSGYLADLIYGFGLHMPIAYRLVTTVGIASLLLQQLQFLRYGHIGINGRLSLVLYPITAGLLYLFIQNHHAFSTEAMFDRIGLYSVIANCCYTVPQIIKNYRLKFNPDLSRLFMWLAVCTSSLDIISAFCLNWDYPNKIGAPLALVLSLVLIHSSGILRYDAPSIISE